MRKCTFSDVLTNFGRTATASVVNNCEIFSIALQNKMCFFRSLIIKCQFNAIQELAFNFGGFRDEVVLNSEWNCIGKKKTSIFCIWKREKKQYLKPKTMQWNVLSYLISAYLNAHIWFGFYDSHSNVIHIWWFG